ncbi:MFS transporter [Carnimonas bestiolae]|uniref:MFS transporter n=1 Tax=Carnimonas bestiolae TaxID=3402172 RepID=UPI003EDB7AD5
MSQPLQGSEVLERALSKVRWRILPLIALLYFIAYLDRSNVSFAKEQMSADLNLSATVFGLGAGFFFIGYTLFEIPSNAGMYRFGARKWIARILIPWGFLAMAMAIITGTKSFYAVRFLLGVAEAGFFPAVIFYFTLWFPVRQRAAILGIFVLAQPIANMLGAPLSGLILGMHGIAGLDGWQWLYLIEGLPAVILGFLAPVLLTDRPAEATWLSEEEKYTLQRAIDQDNAAITRSGDKTFLQTLTDRRALVYSLLNFGMVMGIYGLGFWLPSVVSEMGHYSDLTLGLIVAMPYLAASCFIIWWSRRADRTGKRALHVAMSLFLAAFGLLGAGYTLSLTPILALILLSLAAVGIFTAIGPMLSMPASLFSGAAAAASIGVVNAIGNIGGFVSPFAVGYLTDITGSTRAGLWFLAAALALTGLVTLLYAGRRPEGNTSLATRSH